MTSEISEFELKRLSKDVQDSLATSNSFTTSKLTPVCSEAQSMQASKVAAIKQQWTSFLSSTSLNGLLHVFTSRTLAQRILWAVFLLSGIAFFSYQSSELIRKYYNYTTATKVNYVYEDNADFPAVTICNFNPFRKSVVLTKLEYEKAYEYIMKRAFGLKTNSHTVNGSHYIDLNVTEMYFTAGHQIEDMVKDCTWKNEKCDYRNFTAILTSMGLCHTFNSGKGGQPVLKVKKAGAAFGLRLLLDVEQHDYYSPHAYLAGLKILIHHPDTPPMVDQLGFAVGPGMSSLAAIRKQRVRTLPKPYESNCFNGTFSTVIPGYTKYTTAACLLTCQAKYMIEICGCSDPAMPELNSAKVCGIQETDDCLLRAKGNIDKIRGSHCDCPVPCDTISFQPMLSYAVFPSKNYLKQAAGFLVGGSGGLSAEEIKSKSEFMRENLLELRVYYQDLNYQLIEQTPVYDTGSLLGEIGGQLGLCVGASLLTLIECLDVMFTVIGMRLGLLR